MRLLQSSFLCLVSATLLCAAAIAQQTAPTARIVSPIDEKQLVTIKGATHPLANRANDRGAAPDDMRLDRIHLVLKRSDSQEATLRSLITQMHTPGNAAYHKWLTPDAFGKQFGPADEDIATVKTWLASHGFSVTKVNPGKQTLEFSGNVAQFRSAFHAQVHQYEVNGQKHYANAADPQIPAALSPVVGGFVSLNNFQAKSYAKYLGKAQYDPKTGKAAPEWTVGNSSEGYQYILAPQDFAVQYDLNPLYTAGTNGTGQTIAIINESNINIAAVDNFRTLFGLPANPPQVIIDGNDPGVDGVNNPDGPNFASVEAYLDVEWSGAVAPNATIDLVIGGDTALESGLILAAEHTVYNNVAPVVSLSFGECESNVGSENQFLNELWEQAAAQGMTVMVSSGDSGSAGCDNDDVQEYAVDGLGVNGFGSTPYNVSVGGTDFYYSDFSQGLTSLESQIATYWGSTASNNTPVVSIKGVIPEQPWNDSQYAPTFVTLEQGASPSSTSIAAGSGGASTLYTKPAWQAATGVPSDGQRDLPDVSLFASNGANLTYYPICAVDGDCLPVSASGSVQFSGVGGTSASSPAFAGMMALVNQKYGPQGQANFVLYPLASQFPAAFHDVANGTNSVPCQAGTNNCIAVTNPVSITDPNSGLVITEGQIGTGTTPDYNATAGYDLASGLGTIDANQLVTNWGSVKFASTVTTLSTSSNNFTHGTSVTISGTVTGPSGVPTGNVALMTGSSEPGEQGQPVTTTTLVGIDDETSIGPFPLTAGAFSATTATLPGGTYNIWGQYGGDSKNAESTSSPVSITVSPENSAINFQAYAGSGGTFSPGLSNLVLTYGNPMQLSAIVAPSSANCTGNISNCQGFTKPTGTVAFSDNGTPINTAVINAEGDAEYNAPFAIGAHSVTASYAGDNSYKPSTAAAIAFTVGKDTPVIYFGAPNETNSTQALQVIGGSGQPTPLTIAVENGTQLNNPGHQTPVAAPTGSLSVTGFPSGVPTSATLTAGLDPGTGAVAGFAVINVPGSTPLGAYTVSTSYPGDSNYAAVTAQPIIVQVVSTGETPTTTTATLSGSISPTTSILITGSVTGSGTKAPTGVLGLYSSGYYLTEIAITPGTSDVSTFSLVLNSQSLSQGANFVTLQYFGDTTYAPSAYVVSNPISNPQSDFTLTASSTVVPVTPGSSVSTTINLGSVNGLTGAVSLTCSAATGVTCTIPASETLAAGGSAAAALSISAAASTAAGNYNVLVTATDSTGKHIHTLGIRADIPSIAPAFSLSNGGSITESLGATTGNTSTISVSSSNGFTGTINLTCAVTAAPTGATTPITCSIPATISVTGPAPITTTLTAQSTTSTTQGAYAITVTGKDAATGKITSTTVIPVTVAGLPATVAIVPSATTLTTGTTLQVKVTVTGTSATPTGTVNLWGLEGSTVGNGYTVGGTLSNGSYTFTVAPGLLYAGTDTLTVTYSGDTTYSPETATTIVTVNKIAPSITVVPSVASVYTYQGFTVSGVVSGSAITPTGTVYVNEVEYNSPKVAINADGSYSITVPANTLPVGNNTINVFYSGDTTYAGALGYAQIVIVQGAPLTPTVTVSPASTTVDSAASLTVTGTVVGSAATPTGSVTLSTGNYNSTTTALTGGNYSITIPANSLTVGTEKLTVTYSGDSNYATAAGSASVTVIQSAFSVAASAPASVSPGASTTSTITVSSTTGYDGAVTLGCTLTTSPTGATDVPTCSAGTGAINLTSAAPSGTATVTVSTTASTTSMVSPNLPGTGRGLAGAAGGALLALLVFFGVPARRRSWRSMLSMLALLAILGGMAACGGGGSGGGGGGTTIPGTTAGTYTFTVTATGVPAQATANTTTFTVTVN